MTSALSSTASSAVLPEPATRARGGAALDAFADLLTQADPSPADSAVAHRDADVATPSAARPGSRPAAVRAAHPAPARSRPSAHNHIEGGGRRRRATEAPTTDPTATALSVAVVPDAQPLDRVHGLRLPSTSLARTGPLTEDNGGADGGHGGHGGHGPTGTDISGVAPAGPGARGVAPAGPGVSGVARASTNGPGVSGVEAASTNDPGAGVPAGTTRPTVSTRGPSDGVATAPGATTGPVATGSTAAVVQGAALTGASLTSTMPTGVGPAPTADAAAATDSPTAADSPTAFGTTPATTAAAALATGLTARATTGTATLTTATGPVVSDAVGAAARRPTERSGDPAAGAVILAVAGPTTPVDRAASDLPGLAADPNAAAMTPDRAPATADPTTAGTPTADPTTEVPTTAAPATADPTTVTVTVTATATGIDDPDTSPTPSATAASATAAPDVGTNPGSAALPAVDVVSTVAQPDPTTVALPVLAAGLPAGSDSRRDATTVRSVQPALLELAKGLRSTGAGHATLVVRLDPPELGPVLVRVVLRNGMVSVSCRSADSGAVAVLQQQHSDVQEALRREGFDLAGFDVRQQSAGPGGEPASRDTPGQRADTDGTARRDQPRPGQPLGQDTAATTPALRRGAPAGPSDSTWL